MIEYNIIDCIYC